MWPVSWSKTLNEIGFRKFPQDLRFVSEPRKIYGKIERPVSETLLLANRHDKLNVSGWATLPDSLDLPRIVMLSHSDRKSFFTSAYVTLDSPDIAEALSSKRYKKSRWSVEFSPKYMPRGETSIAAWVYDPEGKQFVKLDGEPKFKFVEEQ